ncbi:hypothetical protein [Flavobacterium stagni]|uniref:SPOR domain-containing protein n=1 Tax=Flavobacterium stagni TaxID=2506421 RepID=A0A4Q1KCE3_9FLAO|nr:hypothetical protein [Flavobacterium stagni]RXR24311.1 hypothetical protein EQG61_02385 [Flavobacterium stagni]
MNANRLKKLLLGSLVLISSMEVSAQLSVPFKSRFEKHLKGDMAMIANTIVNRADYSNGPNDAYYNHTNQAKLNDEFFMDYIDVDDDEATFSSSSAELYAENPSSKKIIFAGLYWSATYLFNEGEQKGSEKYIPVDPARENFTNILIKFPGKEKYTAIAGQLLHDGIQDRHSKDMAPYAVFADVTSQLQALTNPFGVYTVANIKATLGTLSGGSAAGWTLFVVYEDPSLSEKYISLNDGFATLNAQPIDFSYFGFHTPASGNVNVKLAFGALEGDNNLIGDQILLGTKKGGNFQPITDGKRKPNNFFNSSITLDGHYCMNRYPDSKNTLGYDSCVFTVSNPNNSIISNNADETSIRLLSTGDQCFLFFTGMVVDSDNTTKAEEKLGLTQIASKNEYKLTGLKQVLKFVPANIDLLSENNNKSTSSFNRFCKDQVIESGKTAEIQMLKISGAEPAYYLVTGIFKTDENTNQYIKFLNTKGLENIVFTNPLNNYRYVAILKTTNQEEAVAKQASKLDGVFKDCIQIVAVNKNVTQLYADASWNIKRKDTALADQTDKVKLQFISLPNEPKGYYLIANVFAMTENTGNFMNQLKKKGLSPKCLINHQNNFQYVSLIRVVTEEEAVALVKSQLNGTYTEKLWVLSVNSANESITDNDH